MRETISVLMSVYGAEKGSYLDRSLRSIWNDQTRRPDQIVLVEDGALTEELNAVIDRWKEKLGTTLVVCINPENVGLTKSLNIGLHYVTSSLVARADSDDISAPCRFELQEKYMIAHPNVDISGGAMQEFDEQHACLKVRRYPLTHESARKYIVKASPLAHPAVMMRMRIFEEGLQYDERYRLSQDIQLWFDAIIKGYKIGNVSDVILFFRREGDIFKRRNRVKAWSEFKIYMSGIYRLRGLFTYAYIYPIARYCFRNMPTGMIRWIYGSKVRDQLLKSKDV